MNWKSFVIVALFAAGAVNAGGYPRPFFAFCMDTHDAKKRTFQQQAQMLKERGYTGCGHRGLDKVEERIQSLDTARLKLFQIYIEVNVASDAKPAYDPRLKDVLPLLKGRPTQLAVMLKGGPPADPKLNERAIAVLRELSELAIPSGTLIVLYPHTGFWLESFSDALSIVNTVDRDNVGVMFNLCHWLKVSKDRNYAPVLNASIVRLWAVSINGAEEQYDKADWTAGYIQPLDAGAFDVSAFLKVLDDLGYKRAIGLQCYGLRGDAREHLGRSMTAWRKLHDKK
jgi:sugar phosphate isomerase/epimerase